MEKKYNIILELFFITIYIISITYYSSCIINLAGYTSSVRLLLICAVPVLMAAIPALLCKQHQFSFSDLGYRRKNMSKQIMWSIILACLWLVLTVLIPLCFGMDISALIGMPYYGYKIIIFRLIYYFFFVGFTEEFIFRGYYHYLIKKLTSNTWIAIFISSILFGAMHYITSKSFYLVAETILAGITYGFFAHKIKDSSILSTSIAHGLYDAILVIIACIYY